MEVAHSAIQFSGNAMPRLEQRLSLCLRELINICSLLLLSALLTCSQNSDVVPPVIIEGPPLHRIFNPKGMTSLPCIGHGSLPLSYEWYRNGQLLEPNSKVEIGKDGSLNLNEPDEGFYQCRLRNEAGMTISNISHLQAAVCDVTKGRPPVQSIVRAACQSLVLPCSHILGSIPPAIISWKYNDDSPVRLDDRVTVTDNGSLVFTYLLESDSNRDSNSYYRCVAYNSIMRREFGGSYYHLTVSGVEVERSEEAPELLHSSNSTVVVLQGQPFTLSCIFGGVPTPNVEWLLPNGSRLERRRLDIPAALESDQGNYTCRGKTLRHKTDDVIRVIVDALPQVEVLPKGQIAERGTSVRFTCKGFGRPKPTVVWIINGTELNTTEYSGLDGYHDDSIHDDSLILDDVQHSASISCNASNKYGYQLSSTYLLVVDAFTTQSSQGEFSSSYTSAGHVTPKSTTTDEGSNAPSSTRPTPASPTSVGVGEVMTIPDSTKNNSGSANRQQTDGGVGSDVGGLKRLLFFLAVIPVIIIIITVSCVVAYRRWKKKNSQSYSLNGEGTLEMALKAELNRGNDTNCDSDDSGYDDFGRRSNARLKHAKRLSDTPEESYL